MKIHEYQGKQLLKKFDLPILPGQVVENAKDIAKIAESLGKGVFVVKAQIHAGGRGKGGGVKIAQSLEEVRSFTEKMLGMNLVTHQTGPEGKKVTKVLIEKGCNIKNEYYLAFLIDRSLGQPVLIASKEGGMDIEDIAEKKPEAILKLPINPYLKIQSFQLRRLFFHLNIPKDKQKSFSKVVFNLFRCFWEKDVSLLEINPLVMDTSGEFIVLDTKMDFDSNALYRNLDILEFEDPSEEDPLETDAKKHDLQFIKLNGNIGCMVNGAGLAMATMDIIKLHGGNPANFLDVGGGATEEKVSEAFRIILKDPGVKGIFVNIFGGIMKCDIIAKGVLAATKKFNLKIPLVVRLQGTHVEKGKEIFSNSNLSIVAVDNLNEAAKKIVELVKG